MEGEAEKEAGHPTCKLQGERTLLSLKIFMVVGVRGRKKVIGLET